MHHHLLSMSRSLFKLEKKIKLDVAQTLILIKDKIKLNQLTTQPIATVTGIKSMKTALQASRIALDGKSTQNLMTRTLTQNGLDHSMILMPANNNFLKWLRDCECMK